MNKYMYEPLPVSVAKGALLVSCLIVSFFGTSLEMKAVGGIFGCVIFGFWFLLPAYNFQRNMTNARDYERKQGDAISEQERVIDARSNMIREQQELIRRIRNLPTEYARIAERIILEDALFSIDGGRVSWEVDGVKIPIWFAEIWWKAYDLQPVNHLPPISVFTNHEIYSREEMREWTRAINKRLVNLGVVRWPGSQYPARWMVTDEKVRASTLEMVGIPWALRLCEFIKEQGYE